MKNFIYLAVLMSCVSSLATAQDKPAEKPAVTEEKMDAKARAQKHNEKVWQELDGNGDGTITKEESEAFNRKKFEERDTNKDGKVTREEWDAFGDAKRKEFQTKMKERIAEKIKADMDSKIPSAAPTVAGETKTPAQSPDKK